VLVIQPTSKIFEVEWVKKKKGGDAFA